MMLACWLDEGQYGPYRKYRFQTLEGKVGIGAVYHFIQGPRINEIAAYKWNPRAECLFKSVDDGKRWIEMMVKNEFRLAEERLVNLL